MKTVVITGANAGIGLETAKQLEKLGYRQIWLVRNIEKTQQVFAEEKFHSLITLIECDLADMDSIKGAAERLMNVPKIDVLINNAGQIFDEKKYSKDGFELTFATNYLGHYFLTNLILDKLLESKSRVIFLSSAGHKLGRINFNNLANRKRFIPLIAYADAKLCTMNYMHELHERYSYLGLSAFAVDPGIVDTEFAKNKKGSFALMNILMKPFLRPAKEAAKTSVFLATTPDIEAFSGNYFKDCKPEKMLKKAYDPKVGKQLWDYSENLVQKFQSFKT